MKIILKLPNIIYFYNTYLYIRIKKYKYQTYNKKI